VGASFTNPADLITENAVAPRKYPIVLKLEGQATTSTSFKTKTQQKHDIF
jgi:hypothetical protein